MERLPRLIAILNSLQSKRLITAPELAERFEVSVRTIYRDIRTLGDAGIPILIEAGRGITLMSDFRLAPRIFTEEEAFALITAEQIVNTTGDESLVRNYARAVEKVKAVSQYETKDKLEFLRTRMHVHPADDPTESSVLVSLQTALTNQQALKLVYRAIRTDIVTERVVEPFSIFFYENIWTLVGFCRLRQDFRMFRLDCMQSVSILNETFSPHTMTISKYLERFETK